MRAVRRTAAALALGALLTACGSSAPAARTGSSGLVQSASVVLDFTPNAIHSGIYEAIARHLDQHNGVALHVIVPGASTDSIKLLLAGRTQFAILDIHDLAIARQQNEPITGVMAIVERPLAAVIAAPGITSPRELTRGGHIVGVTGDPSDLAVLRSVVGGAGGDPQRLHTVTIGYDAVPDLLSHRVAAATAFWNDEGVTLQQTGRGFHVFRVENYGAPAYPELVLCTTQGEIRRDPALVRGVVHALVEGYRRVVADPTAGAQALESEVSGLSAPLVARQLRGEVPAFVSPDGGVGALPSSTLTAWATWEAKFGIVKHPPDIATMFDTAFLPRHTAR